MLLPKRKISSSTSSKTTGRSKGGNYVTFGEYKLLQRLGSLLVKSNLLDCNDTLHETWWKV